MSRYPGKTVNVPFYDSKTGLYRVKMRRPAESAENTSAAVRMFVASFFPEFYAYMYDVEQFETFENADVDVAAQLKDEITLATSVTRIMDTRPPSSKKLVIYSMSYNVDAKRAELEANNQLPSFKDNLAFFNAEREIGEVTSQATFVVSTLGKTNNSLNDGLQSFNQQLQGFEGQIDLSIDFNSVQGGTQQILNFLAALLSSQTKTSVPNYKFSEADTITIYFAQKNGKIAIAGMDYLLVEESIGALPLKVGYFPLIKYNSWFSDPLTVAILKNYQSILSSVQTADNTTSNFSFMDFLSDPSVAAELGAPPASIANMNPQPKKDVQNVLIQLASEFGLIDVANTENLESGFTTALSSEEMRDLKQNVANNPDLYTRVYANQKAKALNNGVDVTRWIGNVIEQGPMGFIEENTALARIFRQFGLDELAKEAFLCLTFGVNFEAGRINQAVQNALVRTSLSTSPARSRTGATPYQPPDKPKASSISKPKIDPKMFRPFTISGDIWKEILNSVINSLQEAALDAVKDVANLIKENCAFNNPYSSDYGSTNINDLLNTDLESNLLPSVGTGTQLDLIAGLSGMSTEEIMNYLGALSAILSSIEICILFQNRSSASEELIEKILAFNLEYPNTKVSEGMSTVSSIMGFFADLSAVVDVTDLCNDIANALFLLNQDDVCLTADDLTASEADRLLDLIENGLQLQPPQPNLECPEAEGFLNDPTITITVPETFNTLAESVELQFIASADSIREVLLEQVFTTGEDSQVLKNAEDAGVESTGSLENFNPAFLTPLITALESLASLDVQACDPETVSKILPPETLEALGGVQTGLDVATQTLQDPNFQQAIDGLILKLQGITDQASDEPTPMYPSYRFNQQFLNEFENYITMDLAAYEYPTLNIPLYFESVRAHEPALVVSEDYGTQQIIYRFPDIIPEQVLAPAYTSTSFGMVATYEISKLDEAPVCSRARAAGDVIYFIMTAPQSGYDFYDVFGTDVPSETFAERYPRIAKWVENRYGSIRTVPLETLTPTSFGALIEYLQSYTPTQANADALGAPNGQSIIPTSDSWPSAGFAGPWIVDWIRLISLLSGVMAHIQGLDRPCRDPFQDEAMVEINALGLSPGFELRALTTKLFLDYLYGIDPSTDLNPGNSLILSYPHQKLIGKNYTTIAEIPNLLVSYNSLGDYVAPANITETILTAEQEYGFDVGGTTQNPYTKVFVDAFGVEAFEKRAAIENKHFPLSYAWLTDYVFDYIFENGVFDAATLQSLNFFHLNNNCPPSEVSDLLDVAGILDQMQKEFIESACNDRDLPLRKKIRNMIKFGMYLLLVQVAIAEFIIKNIFVFSAFKIEELIETPFIKVFMREQIVASMLRYLANEEQNVEALLRSDLVEYFNLKIRRGSVEEAGGIKFQDGSTAFPAGTNFTVVDDAGFAGFDEIIDFLISERLELSKIPVNNAVKNALPVPRSSLRKGPATMDQVFLRAMKTYEVESDSPNAVKNAFIDELADTNVGAQGSLIFMTKRERDMGAGIVGYRYRLWYYYADESGNKNVFKLKTFGTRTSTSDSDLDMTAVATKPGPGQTPASSAGFATPGFFTGTSFDVADEPELEDTIADVSNTWLSLSNAYAREAFLGSDSGGGGYTEYKAKITAVLREGLSGMGVNGPEAAMAFGLWLLAPSSTLTRGEKMSNVAEAIMWAWGGSGLSHGIAYPQTDFPCQLEGAIASIAPQFAQYAAGLQVHFDPNACPEGN